jgi:hypothetical protein
MLIAGFTNAFAEDVTPVAVKSTIETPAVNTQVASLATATPISNVKSSADPLHADPNWPLFSNCINNTATPAAFQGCLQMAFMGVGPNDQVLALLTH